MTAADLCRTLRVSRTHQLAQTTLHVLAFLQEQGGSAKLTDIADELGISTATAAVTGAIDTLEDSEHVRRQHSRFDRRNIFAHLLPKGKEALAECLKPHVAVPTLGLRLTR